MAVIDVGIRDDMDQLPRLQTGHLGHHVKQHRVLHHIPAVGSEHILRSLVQDPVQGVPADIECHGVGAGVQGHLAQVVVVVQAGEDPAGGGVVLQIPQHLVHLVHVPLGIVVLHPQLIAVCLSDGARLIRPGVPDMAVQVMDIVGLLLPDPQQLVHRGSQILLPHGDDRELLPQVIAVDYPKELHRVGGCPILPAGPDLPVRVPDAPAQDRSAILNKNLIGITHL